MALRVVCGLKCKLKTLISMNILQYKQQRLNKLKK